MNDIKAQKTSLKDVTIDINLDTTPILYASNIFMSTDENGVVLDVWQKLGQAKRMRIVSRIGMSREHAKKFVTKFAKLLTMTEGQLQTTKGKKIVN